MAERNDIVVDFARIAREFGNPKRLILENRLEQVDGRGPTGKILPAGRGDQLLEFRIGETVEDGSFDYDPMSAPGVPAKADDSVFGPIVLPGRQRGRADASRGRSASSAEAVAGRSTVIQRSNASRWQVNRNRGAVHELPVASQGRSCSCAPTDRDRAAHPGFVT